MARQTFEKGQHVWVKPSYSSWRLAIVAEPDVETKGYSYGSSGQHTTHNVRVVRLVDGQPRGEAYLIRNNRANIVTEERYAEMAAEKQAETWYGIVARQQQREDELARYTERAITIVETCGGEVAKLTDYLMAEFNLPRYGHSSPLQVVERRAEYRKDAAEAAEKIEAVGLPAWPR